MPTDLPKEKFWGWCECDCYLCNEVCEHHRCHSDKCHMPKTWNPNEKPTPKKKD